MSPSVKHNLAIITIPMSAVLPDGLTIQEAVGDTFLERLNDALSYDVSILRLSTRQLMCLRSYADLFDAQLVALAGLPGGSTDTLWNSETAPLRRLSVDGLVDELKALRERTQSEDALDAMAAPITSLRGLVPIAAEASHDLEVARSPTRRGPPPSTRRPAAQSDIDDNS